MNHIKELLPRAAQPGQVTDVATLRAKIPELQAWQISDDVIARHRLLLTEYVRQQSICSRCRGYSQCGKEGDMRGFIQQLELYEANLTVRVRRCNPYVEDAMKRRVERFAAVSGSLPQDAEYTFATLPKEFRKKYPALMQYVEQFAETYEIGQTMPGVYLFGPPGVGKTHLMLAVLNRLQERGIPCLVVRSDSIFDRMRHIIADNGDLEPLLDTYASAPVLGIDEFAQERANDFTIEKLFRIINHRFHAKLPTWFTSNFAPPNIYRRNGTDLHEAAAPLRSRIMQMAQFAKLDGEDARQRQLRSLT
ncbi:MAG: ATP-binding protein [Alicyclobacillus sp.]|nr:ATP-binding protein [Alicyclobacillus sp.]